MESMINSAYKILEKEKELFVPIKKIWTSLNHNDSVLSMDQFVNHLNHDERFIVHYVEEKSDIYWDEELMAKLGYFRGPRVGLKSKKLSNQELSLLMAQKLNELIDVLKIAYAENNSENDQIEDEYLKLMKEAKKIFDSIQTSPPADTLEITSLNE